MKYIKEYNKFELDDFEYEEFEPSEFMTIEKGIDYKHILKIGDKIQLSIGKTKYNISVINKLRFNIGLEFDFNVSAHNCDGKCSTMNCWYFTNDNNLYNNVAEFINGTELDSLNY